MQQFFSSFTNAVKVVIAQEQCMTWSLYEKLSSFLSAYVDAIIEEGDVSMKQTPSYLFAEEILRRMKVLLLQAKIDLAEALKVIADVSDLYHTHLIKARAHQEQFVQSFTDFVNWMNRPGAPRPPRFVPFQKGVKSTVKVLAS